MYRKAVCFLLCIIIICSAILIYKIKQTPEYDSIIYNEVYKEYEQISTVSEDNTNVDSSLSNHTQTPSTSTIYITKNSSGDTYRTLGVIEIPKINISYPVINDYSEANLNIAPTKFVGPNLNESGNLVIVGHNNRNKEFFSNLNKLENDDIVKLIDHNNNTKEYKVYKSYEIKQTDYSCLDQNTKGKSELTLITCVKSSKKKRLVVKCVAI